MWQSWMEWKIPLCKWNAFWMHSCLICYFIVKLFYIEIKWRWKYQGMSVDGSMSVEQKFFYRYVQNIQRFAFKILQEYSSWAFRNGAMQMFFLTPNRNMFAVKFVSFSEWKCIVIWGTSFASFCWLWDFWIENLKLKKKLW